MGADDRSRLLHSFQEYLGLVHQFEEELDLMRPELRSSDEGLGTHVGGRSCDARAVGGRVFLKQLESVDTIANPQ
jgi:hypothetical protein